jgi:hypothetical protein
MSNSSAACGYPAFCRTRGPFGLPGSRPLPQPPQPPHQSIPPTYKPFRARRTDTRVPACPRAGVPGCATPAGSEGAVLTGSVQLADSRARVLGCFGCSAARVLRVLGCFGCSAASSARLLRVLGCFECSAADVHAYRCGVPRTHKCRTGPGRAAGESLLHCFIGVMYIHRSYECVGVRSCGLGPSTSSPGSCEPPAMPTDAAGAADSGSSHTSLGQPVPVRRPGGRFRGGPVRLDWQYSLLHRRTPNPCARTDTLSASRTLLLPVESDQPPTNTPPELPAYRDTPRIQPERRTPGLRTPPSANLSPHPAPGDPVSRRSGQTRLAVLAPAPQNSKPLRQNRYLSASRTLLLPVESDQPPTNTPPGDTHLPRYPRIQPERRTPARRTPPSAHRSRTPPWRPVSRRSGQTRLAVLALRRRTPNPCARTDV